MYVLRFSSQGPAARSTWAVRVYPCTHGRAGTYPCTYPRDEFTSEQLVSGTTAGARDTILTGVD